MINNFRFKGWVYVLIILFITATILPTGSLSSSIEPSTFGLNHDSFFVQNQGQFPQEVLYKLDIQGITIWFKSNSLITVFTQPTGKTHQYNRQSIVTKFLNSNEKPTITACDILPHYSNYYLGNNPEKWYTHIPHYQTLYYQDIYPHIDLEFNIIDNTLKYEFIIHPGGNPDSIQINYNGINSLELTPTGCLEISANLGTIYENRPYIYQNNNGYYTQITGDYFLLSETTFGFTIDSYDSSQPLVIDPTLIYSTYIGGNLDDYGYEIAVDTSGNAYIVGNTDSNNYPLQNPHQNVYNGLTDAFVTKLGPNGNTVIFSTYFGGTVHDYGASIDLDSSGNPCIVGTTYSPDFPTHNALFPNLHGIQDAFVAKFTTTGNLLYSTYLGGSNWEWGLDICVDSNGMTYVIGYTDSADFPTFNAYDASFNGGFDMFISKFDPPGGFLMFSTYLGGSNNDIGQAIDDDHAGFIYLTGYTWSTNFPVTPATAYDPSYNGFIDIVLAILDSNAGGPSSLVYGTYIFGQGDDVPHDIVIDTNNIFYVTGETGSTINQFFPITPNAYQQFLLGTRDAFLFKLDPSLAPANQMLYCTYLGGMTGGGGHDAGRSIDLTSTNNAYIAGATECNDFPLVNPLGSYNGANEAFASLIDPTLSGSASLLDSTYIGGSNHDEGNGIAIDQNDDAYITGFTYSTDFPIQNPFQATNAGNADVFVTKLQPPSINNPPNKPTKPSGTIKGSINTNYVYSSSAIDPDGDQIYLEFDWDDGTTSGWLGPFPSGSTQSSSHTWTTKGNYDIKVRAKDIHGVISVWSDPLSISMPYLHPHFFPTITYFFNRLNELFPHLNTLFNF